MTKEEFTKLFSADPNSDDVMTERTKYKTELDEANKRYRERFLSGDPDKDKDFNKDGKVSFDSLFK